MKKVIYLFLTTCLVVSCSKKEDEVIEACTGLYHMLIINVKDKEGKPVMLDEVKVTKKDTNEDITKILNRGVFSVSQKWGSYPIYSDSFLELDKGKILVVNFKGYINNKLVVNIDNAVKAGKCHVYHVFGPREVTIDLEK